MMSTHDTPPSGAGEGHTVTLQIGETADPIRIGLPAGDVLPEDVLPALRTITDIVMARAAAAAEARGRTITCREGCAACCRHLALISDIEARSLADLVERMPEPRRSAVRARFAAAGKRMTEAGFAELAYNAASLLPDRLETLADDYFRLQIACPLLEDERCSVYDDRPLVCRRAVVTSPAAYCANPGDKRLQLLLVPKLTAAILLMTSDETPPRPTVVPLALALDWAWSNRDDTPQRGADIWMRRFISRLPAGVG
ncbi:MAG TPA: YkgJ family cysteine cluster protein [Vineibacter sp.]|nr:YkgJ family cysteine cluster protein [Vineibacter sp.]